MGAVGELKKLASQFDRRHLQSKTAELGLTWRFNPRGAPHFEGAHEVMVKAAKKAIYVVVGERDVNDEELITVFAGVESLLNSRPLTYQSSDPRDSVPLTPNHFLHGQMGGQFAPESVETTGYSLFSKCCSWFFYLGVHRGTGVFSWLFFFFTPPLARDSLSRSPRAYLRLTEKR